MAENDAYLLRIVPSDGALTIPNAITFSGALTVTGAMTTTGGVTRSGLATFNGGVVLGPHATPLRLTGAFTTGITISADGDTGISITSGFTGVDMVILNGTASRAGINISGACADGIVISGAMSDNGIEISGTCTDSCIQFLTGTSAYGLYIAQLCTTAGIAIVGDCQTGITIGAQTTAGIAITGATATGINISGTCTTDIQLQNGATIVNGAVNTLTITEAIIDLTASTRIDLDGDVLLTGGLTLDGSSDITMRNGATIANGSAGVLTLTEDGVWLVAGGHNKIVFGGETDWGTGVTGTLIDGTGWDWVTQTVGHVDSGALATACAAAYHALTVTALTHSTASSFFGTWTELYVANSVDLTGAANAAAVWGQFEAGTGVTLSDTGDFTTAVYANVKAGATLTVTAGHVLNGVRAQLEVAAISSASARTAAFECLKGSGVDWDYGLYVADCTTGINIGTCTTGISIDGTITTGIYLEPSAMTNGLRIGAPGTAVGTALPTGQGYDATGAPVGIYFEDRTALTEWGESFTVGSVVTQNSIGAAQTGWPYTAMFYNDIRANITSNAAQHWPTVMINTAIASGKTVDGFTSHGVSSLHLSCDINGELATSNTMSNLSFGGNSPGTITGDWVCMHVRDTTGDFSAFFKIDTNATGCYTAAYTGNGAFVPNSKGTFTQTGQLRIIVAGATVYVPYGTVAN